MNFTSEEIKKLREDTVGIDVAHFNNAGSALPTKIVVETVKSYIDEEALVGGYEAEDRYGAELNNSYHLIGRLINAKPDEIAVVESASMGWGIAFKGIPFQKGDVIITSQVEYGSNLMLYLQAQKNFGIDIKIIPTQPNGSLSTEKLKGMIDGKTKLISITHIPSNGGLINPIAEIGKIARAHSVLFLVDACQSVGQLPINVEEIQCDILTSTGRKFLRAPRGTGFLYVRKSIQDQLDPLFPDSHSAKLISGNKYEVRDDARRFESFEGSRALKLGLNKAVEYALSVGVERSWTRIKHLADLLRNFLSTLPNVTLHDIGDEKCGIVTLSIKNVDPFKYRDHLRSKKINISVSTEGSAFWDMESRDLKAILRISIHYYNTEEEINLICSEIAKAAKS